MNRESGRENGNVLGQPCIQRMLKAHCCLWSPERRKHTDQVCRQVRCARSSSWGLGSSCGICTCQKLYRGTQTKVTSSEFLAQGTDHWHLTVNRGCRQWWGRSHLSHNTHPSSSRLCTTLQDAETRKKNLICWVLTMFQVQCLALTYPSNHPSIHQSIHSSRDPPIQSVFIEHQLFPHTGLTQGKRQWTKQPMSLTLTF